MENCNPLALTTAVNTLAVMLASCLDDRELAWMSAVLVQLGDTLNTVLAQRGLCACGDEAT